MQHLKLSQFILTYGPGAIIEGPKGPRLIPRPDIGLFRGGISPEDFEISDERISEALLGGGRIFRLPSTAELGWTDRPVYRTRIFPEWWICSSHWKLFRYWDGCPDCRREGVPGHRRKWDAVRFVMACAKGHLDDVRWHFVVHIRTGGECRKGPFPKYYNWRSSGGSLRDIRVECPKCGASVSIGYLYEREWKCSGRYPEREPIGVPSTPEWRGCDESALVVLRQASNLRIPEVFPVFTLRLYTELHNLLALREVKLALELARKYGRLNSKEELRDVLDSAVETGALSRDIAMNILEHPWDEIKRVMDEILTLPSVTDPVELIKDEFEVFQRASEEGAPPVRGRTRVVFEVPEDRIRRNVRGPYGLKFRVAPATRLRTILVQLGYRRYVKRISRNHPEEVLQADLVPVHFTDSRGYRWYPGVEMLGEGIFIRLEDSEKLAEDGDAWNAWLQAFGSPHPRYRRSNALQRNGEELHPGFVWWHTLSHLLIRILSVDSGYSSAAIRERVYFEKTDQGFTGGIVLYTVQPGEGTMGGLVSQIDNFEFILQRAFEIAEICPNDPLCADHVFRNGRIAGSACYACLFVSETSCEHRNMWLDRKVLLEGTGHA